MAFTRKRKTEEKRREEKRRAETRREENRRAEKTMPSWFSVWKTCRFSRGAARQKGRGFRESRKQFRAPGK